MPKNKRESPKRRYGIGEWYGKSFTNLDPIERADFLRIQRLEKEDKPKVPCPFKTVVRGSRLCTKNGGVCSLRLYELNESTNEVTAIAGRKSPLVTICPYRFQESKTIFTWIGETVLQHKDPIVVKEVGFLKPLADREDVVKRVKEVGRIDSVLVHPDLTDVRRLHWCAVEIQAVYFSGPAMRGEFNDLELWKKTGIPFPQKQRRPDFRSSAPKRLMPQLQIKVPTLSRWGKKMAVVIDRSFFEAMGPMDEINDISNCDIAWFVVNYEQRGRTTTLVRDFVKFTTLEGAVKGLTGGSPVTREVFQSRLLEKISAKGHKPGANSGSD